MQRSCAAEVRFVLTANFVGLIQSPINALQRGLSPDKPAAENYAKLSELAAESKTEKREIFFRGTDEPIMFNQRVKVGGAIITSQGGIGSHLRMAATGLGLFELDALDTLIRGMYLTSASNRDTVWGGSSINSAILINEGMHGATVLDTRGDNWTIVVHASGGPTSTRRIYTRGVRGEGVAFVVNLRGVSDFTVLDTSGSISFDKANKTSSPPHHVYLSWETGMPWNENGTIRGVYGWNSPDSSTAVKLDHLRGSSLSDVQLDNCCGLAIIDTCEDVSAHRLIATNDHAGATVAGGAPAIYITQTVGESKRVEVSDFEVQFAPGDHGAGVHADRGSGHKVRRGKVFTNRLTTTSNGAVRADLNDTLFEDIEVGTLSAQRTNAAFYLNQTNKAKVRRPKANGSVFGVQLVGAVDTVVDYDPADMAGLAVHNSAAPVSQDTATIGSRVITPTLPSMGEVAPIAWFDARRRGPLAEAPLAVLQSGQTVSASGTWRHAASSGGVDNQDNGSTAGVWLDTLTADHRVETLVTFAGIAVGVSARVTDNDNRLYAEVTTTGVTLSKRVAGVVTQLAAGGPPVAKARPPLSRRYRRLRQPRPGLPRRAAGHPAHPDRRGRDDVRG